MPVPNASKHEIGSPAEIAKMPVGLTSLEIGNVNFRFRLIFENTNGAPDHLGQPIYNCECCPLLFVSLSWTKGRENSFSLVRPNLVGKTRSRFTRLSYVQSLHVVVRASSFVWNNNRPTGRQSESSKRRASLPGTVIPGDFQVL